MLLFKIYLFITCGKILDNSIKTKTKKIIAPTRNDESELPYGFYSVSDIQYHMEYIIKKT